MLKKYEENLKEFNNSAQIFNFLCEMPQLFEYEYNRNEQIFHDLPKLYNLTSTTIDSYRRNEITLFIFFRLNFKDIYYQYI